MESLLIGSFHRPSIPVAAEFSPLKTSSHAIVRVLKCKAWKRPKKHYSTSMKLQRQYITQEHVGGSDLSTIAADKNLKGGFWCMHHLNTLSNLNLLRVLGTRCMML
uniref:Putative ovule protein n=1 Tax=Solanum chacoense TaxID=4108 RepID=A0A0V0HXG3_SOLCH